MTMPAETSTEVAAAPAGSDGGANAADQSAVNGSVTVDDSLASSGDVNGSASGQGESDDWDLEVPEDKYVPRDLITEARNRYTNERLKRKEYEGLLEEWGGRDSAKEAVEFYKHLQTEEGVIDVFLEAAKSLGIGTKQLEALFAEMGAPAGGGQPGSDLEDTDDDDRVLTLREARELLAKEVTQPLEERQRAEATQRAQATVAAVLKEVGAPEDATMDILQLGDKHLPAGSLDPEAITAAVRKGYAEWVALGEKAAKEYLTKKEAQAAQVPKVGGGSAPGAEPPSTPKSVEEAKARVREKLRAGAVG